MKRYPGTAPFKTEDALIFRGRQRESEEVLNLILAQKMLTIFAVSGMGKTSLLNAGVIPRLSDYDFYSITIRFNEGDNVRNENPVERFCKRYEEAHQEFYHIWQNKPEFERKYVNGHLSLWLTLKENKLTGFTPVLIFDQFEEFFRTYPTKEKRARFLRQLAELLLDYVPQSVTERSFSDNGQDLTTEPLNIRVIFSIRADMLVYMQEVSEFIPFIKRFQYELKPLSDEQAKDAIVLPGLLEKSDFKTGPLIYSHKAIAEIIEGSKHNFTREIESFQLQLICGSIENDLIEKFKAQTDQARNLEHTVTPKNYGGLAGIKRVNQEFVQNTLNELKKSAGVDQQVVLNQLVELLNDSGNRILRADSELDLSEAVKATLVDKRILKKDQITGKEGFYCEISHDKIAEVLKEPKAQKELQVRQNQIDENKKQIQRRNWLISIITIMATIAGVIAFLIYEQNSRIEKLKANIEADLKDKVKLNKKIKEKSDSLAVINIELNGNNKQLSIKDTTIGLLFQKRKEAYWNIFELAKSMMNGKLFKQANEQLTLLQRDINEQKQFDSLQGSSRQYTFLETKIKEGRRITKAMSPVQSLMEQAKRFQGKGCIYCAGVYYIKANEEQKKISKYHFYKYENLDELEKQFLNNPNLDKEKCAENCSKNE